MSVYRFNSIVIVRLCTLCFGAYKYNSGWSISIKIVFPLYVGKKQTENGVKSHCKSKNFRK